MGASGVVLAAAAAHAKSGMGLEGAGYLLLFHAIAVLSGVALLQQGLPLRPLALGVLSRWVLGSALFAGNIALRASSATAYFPWQRQPAESYSFWHGSRSLWLPFWRWCAASSGPNDGPMTTRLEHACFQANPDYEMVRPHTDAPKRAEIIHEWHKSLLHKVIPALIRKWEPKLGVKVHGYFLQRMKTKWGSCNHRAGHIRLNTELVKKPRDLLEYVIVHEMLHLVEPTHSERFISLLSKHFHAWREARAELNELPLTAENWRE